MTSMYWRPITPDRVDSLSTVKRLGHGIYELWSRCDLCYLSGPCYGFVQLVRGADECRVCTGCWDNPLERQGLERNGWTQR